MEKKVDKNCNKRRRLALDVATATSNDEGRVAAEHQQATRGVSDRLLLVQQQQRWPQESSAAPQNSLEQQWLARLGDVPSSLGNTGSSRLPQSLGGTIQTEMRQYPHNLRPDIISTSTWTSPLPLHSNTPQPYPVALLQQQIRQDHTFLQHLAQRQQAEQFLSPSLVDQLLQNNYPSGYNPRDLNRNDATRARASPPVLGPTQMESALRCICLQGNPSSAHTTSDQEQHAARQQILSQITARNLGVQPSNPSVAQAQTHQMPDIPGTTLRDMLCPPPTQLTHISSSLTNASFPGAAWRQYPRTLTERGAFESQSALSASANASFLGVHNPALLGGSRELGGVLARLPTSSTEATAIASPDGTQGHPTNLPVLLYQPGDEQHISPFQCLVRQHIELFEAGEEEASTNARGRNKPVVLGQVGIRCRHCACLPVRKRLRASMYYPQKLELLYQASQSVANDHLCNICKHIPANIRAELLQLRKEKATALAGKSFWAERAREQGIFEDEEGLRFKNNTS